MLIKGLERFLCVILSLHCGDGFGNQHMIKLYRTKSHRERATGKPEIVGLPGCYHPSYRIVPVCKTLPV